MLRIELEGDFIARTKDRQLIVESCEQWQDVAVTRVAACGPSVRPGGARLLIDVFHIARRLVFDLQRETVESEIGARQRNICDARWLMLGGVADQNAIPVNLKIRCDEDALCAERQLVGEVCDHGSRAAGGET